MVSHHLPERHGYGSSSVPMCGVASPLSSAEVLWRSLPADVGDGRVSLGLQLLIPSYHNVGDQEIAHPYGAGHEHHREAQPGKQRDKASGENKEMRTLCVSCYCKRWTQNLIKKKIGLPFKL